MQRAHCAQRHQIINGEQRGERFFAGEELARGEGLSEFGELIARSEEIRPNTYLSVTSCAAKDYLAAIKPTNEVNPVQYYQVIFDSDYTGFIPHNPSQDFYAKNMSAACENVLPLSGIKSDGEAGIFTDNFEYMTKNYFAGEVEADESYFGTGGRGA